MKQRTIFDDIFPSDEKKEHHNWILFVDGASRNNPGPSGAGMYLVKNDIMFEKDGFYLGVKTNNQAEYLALLIGLLFLTEYVQEGDSVHIVSDSQLLVRQLMGLYKVKQDHLKPLHAVCTQKMRALRATIAHVLREKNGEADAMANQGIDLKKSPPKKYITLLKDYGISL